VVFDLDGTLVDSVADLTTAVNEALGRLAPGAPTLAVETVRAYVGNGAGALISRSIARAGVSVPVEAAREAFLECYGRRLLDTTRPYPGVVEGLQAMKPPRLAVLTNKPGDLSRRILEGLGLARYFARIWGAGDVPLRKPDPGGLLGLLAALEVPGEDALMVGDSAVDVQTARAAGVRAVGVTYGLDPASLEREPPDARVGSLLELALCLERGEL
jgi:phosphoglycolate phosphatase